MNNGILWLIVGIGALLFLRRNGGVIPPDNGRVILDEEGLPEW